MIECQLCGALNDDSARFCAAWSCGTALGGAPPGPGARARPSAAGVRGRPLGRRAVVAPTRHRAGGLAWLPVPLATALGAMAVAALAFGGLTLASGSTLRPDSGGSVGGSGRPPGATGGAGSGTARAVSGPAAAPASASAVVTAAAEVGAVLPLGEPVTSTPRGLPPGTACRGAAVVPGVSRQRYPVSSQTLLAAGFPGLDIAEHSVGVPLGGTISVRPAPGTAQPCGTQVTLVYSSGPVPARAAGSLPPDPPLCTLPPAEGSATAVQAVLRALVADDRGTGCGLLVTTVDGYAANVPAGDVISETPLPGTRLGIRSAVVLTVSLGAPPCVLPSVTGDSPATAAALLGAVRAADGSPCRLVVVQTAGDAPGSAAGTVTAQSPRAGAAVPPGAVVTLTVAAGPPPSAPPGSSPPASGPVTPPDASPPASAPPASAPPGSAPPGGVPPGSAPPGATASASGPADPASATPGAPSGGDDPATAPAVSSGVSASGCPSPRLRVRR
ncbi:PASTA domain-containing protein [Streptacidiphilus sp. PB12-B1b]|uniref:PASTA domain-containing protein n=1 Tax=Streptacidiphilus sp. PB12-B1b TaxID=2705012 RepID=UPI0015F84970|nr:PASTA domain-containing protein [Streptacidiphilus sp. PB12-B1b]QMU75979.1 PASTA domain-containing protein [Streptacidiphilus sp. PB12-B1b]